MAIMPPTLYLASRGLVSIDTQAFYDTTWTVRCYITTGKTRQHLLI